MEKEQDQAQAEQLAKERKERKERQKQEKELKKQNQEQKKQEQKPKNVQDSNKKDKTGLGIEVKKSEDFAKWYTQVITQAEMIEYYDVSGCYILRPWSYFMWEQVKDFVDSEIKKMGVENAYFPLFVSKRALTTEEDHIKGFAPEVAWVTHSGDSQLAEPIAVRPTSETIMYPAYSKWIRSHRDLPLKINQWCNVVRWEFKHPTPFLRSREFLWQEGHTAFATKEEADEEVLQILELYRRVFEDLLAVPVIKGKKSENEKFAGGLYTTTVEGYIPGTGKGIQGATSHCLGQNFSKMFNIQFENDKAEKAYAWQNSWGITTRTIGVMVMVHSDDKGLVLPPRMAPIQVVLVPITMTSQDETEKQAQLDKAAEIIKNLKSKGIRAHLDDRKGHNPGFKYNHWELRGVPLRIELGPKDMKNQVVVISRRDNGSKETVSWSDLESRIPSLLNEVHKSLFEKAKSERDSHILNVDTWDKFTPGLDNKNIILTPWCDTVECEEKVKERSAAEAKEALKNAPESEQQDTVVTGAKTLCIPFESKLLPNGACCFACGKPAKVYVLWGRSF